MRRAEGGEGDGGGGERCSCVPRKRREGREKGSEKIGEWKQSVGGETARNPPVLLHPPLRSSVKEGVERPGGRGREGERASG